MRFTPARATIVAVMTAAATALAGCGGDESEKSTAADDGSELVIYAPMEGERADWLTKRAKSELSLDLNVVVGGGADLAQRLEAEKNKPQADAVIGIAEPQLNTLAAADVLADTAPTWAEEIPAEMRAQDQPYTLYTQTPIVIAYNKEAIRDLAPPTAWQDLAKPEYKGKFVFPSLTGQTGQAAVVGLLWPYVDAESGEVSDAGWKRLKAILANARPMAARQNVDIGWVKSGEVPIVVDWLGGVETLAQDNDLDLEVIDTAGGTPFVMTGVAITAGATNEANAKKFIDWYGSAATQTAFVRATNNDTPLLPAALTELPEAKASVQQVSKQEIDWSVAAPNLTGWMERVQLDVVG